MCLSLVILVITVGLYRERGFTLLQYRNDGYRARQVIAGQDGQRVVSVTCTYQYLVALWLVTAGMVHDHAL